MKLLGGRKKHKKIPCHMDLGNDILEIAPKAKHQQQKWDLIKQRIFTERDSINK